MCGAWGRMGVKGWVRWDGCVKGGGGDGTRLRQTAKHSSRDAPHRAKSERWLERIRNVSSSTAMGRGARGCGSRAAVKQLGVRDAPALGERLAASACSCSTPHAVPPASVRVVVRVVARVVARAEVRAEVRVASGRGAGRSGRLGGSKGVSCDASQNPHRARRRGQESGGARGFRALSVGRVPRRPSLMGGDTSQTLESPGRGGQGRGGVGL